MFSKLQKNANHIWMTNIKKSINNLYNNLNLQFLFYYLNKDSPF